MVLFILSINSVSPKKGQLGIVDKSFVTDDEVCQDEIDADRAAYDAISDICLDALLDVEPKGDA